MNQSTLPFERAEEFRGILERRGFSDTAIGFLLLCFQAANGTAPAGIEGQFVVEASGEALYVVTSRTGKLSLAFGSGIHSERGLDRVTESIEQLGCLVKRTTRTFRGRQSVYIVRVTKLLDLPEISEDNPLEAISDVLRNVGIGAVALPRPNRPTPPVVTGGECQGATENEFAGRLEMVTERKDTGTDHGPVNPNRVGMANIIDRDVRLIAGLREDLNKPLSREERVAMFATYWRDAKTRENLSGQDTVELLALFLHWGRAGMKPKAGKKNPRGACVATWWRHRHTMPLSNTIHDGEYKEARAMLESRKQPAEAAPVRVDNATPEAFERSKRSLAAAYAEKIAAAKGVE